MANSQLSADHAVIFPELPGSSPLDYLQEIGAIIGSSQIHSFYNTESFIKIYLKERIHVEKVVESGIVVLGHHLQANNVESTLLKITLSRVDPIVPDSFLEDLLNSYGTLVSSITHRNIFEDASFSHIDSGARYVDLKVFKGICIPTTIQVQYKDILCAVDVKVEKESQLKKSVGVRSSRKSVVPNKDASTVLEDSTASDAKSSKESAFEFISQSAETVKINPRRSVKKISNCGESATVSSNTFTQSANGIISSTSGNGEDLAVIASSEGFRRNIDHLPQHEQRLSVSNAINICDLSLPKSAENRYDYLNRKQRLKSDIVLNELISKNFFQIGKDSSPTAREQHSFRFGIPRNKRINVSRYPKIKSDKRNQKKSVISELLSIHRTERQVIRKVNSCVLDNLCDIQQVNPPNTIVWSRIKKKINDRLKIGKLLSNGGLVPNEVSNISTNKPVTVQKLNERSRKTPKEKTSNKRLKFTPKSSSNNAHCSSASYIANFEHDLYDTRNSNLTRSLRPRSKTGTVCPNPPFTYEQNESSDTFTILPETNENCNYLNSTSNELRSFEKIPSNVSQQNLPSCSKTFKTSKNQKSTHVLAQDISSNVFASSSLTDEEKSGYSNLKDSSKHLNKKILESKCQQKKSQSRFKKIEKNINQTPTPALSQGIACNDVVHSSLLKPKSKTGTTYIKTVTTIEHSNKSPDTLPQATESSKCLNWISHSSEKRLKDSKKRQAKVKYGRQQKLSSRTKAFKTSKYQKPTPVFTQDVASNNVAPTLLTGREKSQYPKLNKNLIDFDKKSSGAECRSQQERSQYKLKKVKTNLRHMPPRALPQNITCNVVPSLLVDSQSPDLRTSSSSNRSKLLDKKSANKQQTTSNGSSIHRKRKTWNSISAAAKNVTCLDDVFSLSKKKKPRDSDLNANLSKEELSGFEKRPSDDLHLNQKESSSSSSKPEVTSITPNSKPASTFEVEPNFSSSKEKSECSEETVNSSNDKLNDFNKSLSDTQSENQLDKLPSNSENEEMAVSLDSEPVVLNVKGSDGDLSSNKEESSCTELNEEESSCTELNNSSSYTHLIPPKQAENLQFSTKNNEIKHDTNINSLPDFVQDTTSFDASPISPSNKQTTQALGQNNEESSGFNKGPLDTQCKNLQDNLQSNPKEVNMNANLDPQPNLALNSICSDEGTNLLLNKEDISIESISSSKDFNKVPSDTLSIKQPENLQSFLKNDEINPNTNLNLTPDLCLDNANCDADTLSDSSKKEIRGTFDLRSENLQSFPRNDEINPNANLNLTPDLCLDNANCNADTLSDSSNKEIHGTFDLNASLSSKISQDVDQSQFAFVNQEISLQCSTEDKMNITSNCTPVSSQNSECYNAESSLPSSTKDVPHCTELSNGKSVDFIKEQFDTQSTSLEETLTTNSEWGNTDKNRNLNPVVAQSMETSDISPSLFPSNKNPQSLFQKNSSSDCKSTDYDLGQSNPQCENLKPSTILTETIKPPKIGICLPIPQCPTNSSAIKSLNFNQKFAYKQCINPQKIAKSNNRKHDKVCQGPNSISGSDMYVKQCHSNSQSKSSQKKSDYGIRSIFYNSKTNNAGNRNKNTKVAKKRKLKSKAKTLKVKMTSDPNSRQNKGCFSEYEFNSSDSDSKDISYSKWRSQKQTPKKRIRSSSLDNVNSTGFPPSLANNSTNILPYDLSMKSRKLSPTIVNSARYDYNTLIRKKRERLDAICRRVSLINKGNQSIKPLLTCEKEKTIENISNHTLSVPTCAMNNNSAERQQNIECHSQGLNVLNSQFMPEVISNSVLPLSIPRVDCNFNSLNSMSITIIEKNKEAIHRRQQVLESKDSVQLRNSSNYKSTIKSLQNKDFKKSLSQIHAKKVRKRMKKNTVRYMCLQNDGKKIILKKVSTAPDSNKNPIDLTNRTPDAASMVKETAASGSNELENNKESNPVELAATVKDNSIVPQPTETTDYKSCVNGFLQQLVNSNQPNTDVDDFSAKHLNGSKPLNLVNKTLVEHRVDNVLQLDATINENVDLVDKDIPNPQSKKCQSTVGVNGSIEGLQPNIGISCSSSSGNLVFPENTEVVKDVGLSQSRMDEPNEKCIDAAVKNITSESSCPSNNVQDGVAIKQEPADPEECTDGDVQDASEDVKVNSQKLIAVDVPDLNLHFADAQTAVSNDTCINDNDQDDVISSIKITEVYGSVMLNPIYCDQIEKVPGNVLIIPENCNLINNSDCEPVCFNDCLNENLMERSETSKTSDITIKQLSSGSVHINSDGPIQRVSDDVHVQEKCNQLCNNRSNNETCVEDIAFEQNGVNAERGLNQSTIVRSRAENEMGVTVIKCEKDQPDSLSCASNGSITVDATSVNEVRKLYQQDSEKDSASTNNENHQIVPPIIKLEKNETLSSGKGGHNGLASTSDSSHHEFPTVSNQELSRSVSSKSTANIGVAKIIRSPGGSVKVKKEKGLPLSNTKVIVSTPAKFHTTKLLNRVKNKTMSSMRPTQHSKSYKHVHVSEKERATSSANDARKDLCTVASTSVNKERKLDSKDNSESKMNQELSNSEGHYMIEKTEKPNTFRIFRQTSISSDNATSTLSNPINKKIGQPGICTEKVSNNVQQELVRNDDKWGPYLAVPKDKSEVCAKRLKRRRSSNKELSPKKKCFNSCLSVNNVNSNEIIGVDNNTIVPAEDRAGSSSQSVNNEACRLDTSVSVQANSSKILLIGDNDRNANSSKILLIGDDDRNANSSKILLIGDDDCDIDPCKNSAYTLSNSTTSSTACESNTKSPSVDSPSDNFILPCDETVAVEAKSKDIYSIYRNISQDCKNSVRSVINFPLSEQRLNKFLQQARGHSDPRKLALNVLQNNKTPGALKELIVQLYDYFKVCNDRKKQLRVSRLIMLLDNRNK